MDGKELSSILTCAARGKREGGEAFFFHANTTGIGGFSQASPAQNRPTEQATSVLTCFEVF
jgi:hypothetical protein